MAQNTYPDGFPLSPYEAIEYSYFLSDTEKQEWKEWLQTATLEQQNELVDILHSMWMDNQKQVVPQAFTSSTQTQAAPANPNNQFQPNNLPPGYPNPAYPLPNTGQSPQNFNQQNFQPQQFAQTNWDMGAQANNGFGQPQNTPPVNNSQNNAQSNNGFNFQQPNQQFNQDLNGFVPTQPNNTYNNQNPWLGSPTNNFQPTSNINPQAQGLNQPSNNFNNNFAQNNPEPTSLPSRVTNPSTSSNFNQPQPNPFEIQASSQPSLNNSASFSSNNSQATSDDDLDFSNFNFDDVYDDQKQEQAIMSLGNAKYNGNPLLDEVSKDKSRPSEFVYKNQDKSSQRSDDVDNFNFDDEADDIDPFEDKPIKNTIKREIEPPKSNQTKKVNPQKSKIQEKEFDDFDFQDNDMEEEFDEDLDLDSVNIKNKSAAKPEEEKKIEKKKKPGFFNFAKLRESTSHDAIEDVYKEYQSSRDKNFESLSTLLEKIINIVMNFEQIPDYIDTVMDQILKVNDTVVGYAKDIQALKDATQARGSSLQDQVDELRDDVDKVVREIQGLKSQQRRRMDEFSQKLATIDVDVFQGGSSKAKLDYLESKIVQIQSKLGILKSSDLLTNSSSDKSQAKSSNSTIDLRGIL